jgi:hypothetical protein
MSEIGIAVSKRVRAAVVDNFRSFTLKSLGAGKEALSALVELTSAPNTPGQC